VQNRLYLWVAMLCGFLPYISVWCGWWVREVSRQPWVVYGLMRTEQGVSHMSVTSAVLWLIGYMLIELTVWGSTWFFFTRIVRRGPDLESPVIHGIQHQLGAHEPRHDSAPSFVRSV
jgi:cytochrome d ubiquinol oxidase subunit I